MHDFGDNAFGSQTFILSAWQCWKKMFSLCLDSKGDSMHTSSNSKSFWWIIYFELKSKDILKLSNNELCNVPVGFKKPKHVPFAIVCILCVNLDMLESNWIFVSKQCQFIYYTEFKQNLISDMTSLNYFLYLQQEI